MEFKFEAFGDTFVAKTQAPKSQYRFQVVDMMSIPKCNYNPLHKPIEVGPRYLSFNSIGKGFEFCKRTGLKVVGVFLYKPVEVPESEWNIRSN